MIAAIQSCFLQNKKPMRRIVLTVDLDALDYDAAELEAATLDALRQHISYIESTLILRP